MALSIAVVLESLEQISQLQQQLNSGQLDKSQLPLKLQAVGAGALDPKTVTALNPALARNARQRSMARWLLPFGFAAGMMFTFITNLDTFAFAGPIGQPLIGGLLGLGSGWMGSFAAAASVTGDRDDQVRTVCNRLTEGLFVLLVEAAPGQTIPWALIQAAKPKLVVRLRED
jgi:peptidoglycan hydrolase-like protein with peptidoglycan-binding domain